MDEWQPIETAPILPNEETKPMLVYGYVRDMDEATVGVGTHNRNGWWFHHPDYEDALKCFPTHWQLLPAPPAPDTCSTACVAERQAAGFCHDAKEAYILIARLKARLALAEAVCRAVWEHEQAEDVLMAGMRLGALVQIWHDATERTSSE